MDTNRLKQYMLTGVISLTVSLGVVWLAPQFFEKDDTTLKIEHISGTPVKGALYTVDDNNEVIPLDFTAVSEEVMDAVVHIASTQTTESMARGPQGNRPLPDPFRDFFGDDFFERFFGPRGPQSPQMPPQARVGTGSGVIINEDGYIVTNNHVIDQADDIEVTLHDNRSYKGIVIGTDPSTDLALIKIEANGLPTLPLVDSDQVKVGEWVLAVGNPFNLNSTVTAGIVSAKSRNINILRDQYAIESFIQTDAAINPGNSGGALVNLNGGLVGVNTAIASPTGAYAGYGFAVPSNIVNKVVEDLLKYGVVQRGYLGVTIRAVNANLVKEKDLSVSKGVFVDSVMQKSAANDAGIRPGDVIMRINDIEVSSAPELQEQIARKRPGDLVKVQLKRENKDIELNVELKNREGSTDLVASSRKEIFELLGADLQELDQVTASRLNISGGVKVVDIHAGKLAQQTKMREGFIITKVDNRPVKTPEELERALQGKRGGVMLEGIYEDSPEVHYYAFGM